MKFALIRERKNPPDRRVVLSPEACLKVREDFPQAEIVVESSNIRVFPDSSYEEVGCDIVTDLSGADVLLGVKEVPIDSLIAGKSYFFFSHTIKKQPYNRKLLQAILEKNITLYDHETLVDKNGNRLIGFGYYAGVVGAYNGIRAWGLTHGGFEIPKANDLKNRDELNGILKEVKMGKMKILLSGTGRVGSGAKEILDQMNIKEVSPKDYIENTFEETVYTNIDVLDYNERIDGRLLDKYDFYRNPKDYQSTFMKFASNTDLFIAGHFYGDGAPFLFTREDAKSADFNIKVVADISCDIDGPVACTIRPSTIADPIYGYDAQNEKEVDYKDKDAIVVMAVDNLPCELPDNASRGFGFMFIKHVLPAFFNEDEDGVLERAKMTENGKLTERFSYLQEYVDGKE